MNTNQEGTDISSVLARYRSGQTTPRAWIQSRVDAMARAEDSGAWIHRCTMAELEPYLARLERVSPDALPLYGVPFAIKDNIDLAGVPTTAACPAFAYVPEVSAPVVADLVEAGAVPLGKTNLDQFATGLVGVRTPYGIPGNAFDPAHISGGSSSGSAVVVATGQVSFALGTDTAGSGRVPAAFNNVVGLKPTRGLISTRGVVPACRSLDCVSVFALSCGDAHEIWRVVERFDPADPFSRRRPPSSQSAGDRSGPLRFGVPRAEQWQFFGNDSAAQRFEEAVARWEQLGGVCVAIDFQPFLDAARLLYEGPWVAERYAAIRGFMEHQAAAMHPVTKSIIEAGAKFSAVSAFEAFYRLAALKRMAEAVWDQVEFIMSPTAGTIYRIAEIEQDPIRLNANLGYYTNFMNLLDLAAVAVPAGFLDRRLPFGVTLFAPAGADERLLSLADRFHRDQDLPLGTGSIRAREVPKVAEKATSGRVSLAVCGAHMRGMALHHQLQALDANFVRSTRTAPHYRFYALAGTTPPKPGLVRDAKGASIEIEIWSLTPEAFGKFVAAVPRPLCIGQVETADGELVSGFLCESAGLEDAKEITALGSWRSFVDGAGG